MAERTIVEAINDCFHVELERDPDVMVLGEDVGRAGGVFRATVGLRDRFGPNRCVDTPLAEAGILGSAVGLAGRVASRLRDAVRRVQLPGARPAHQPRRPLPLAHRRPDGVPARRRMPYGGGVRAPELDDETYYVHTPGVKVAIPSPADAKGLLAAAIRDPDPSSSSSRSCTTAPSGARSRRVSRVVPLGRARLAREGDDVTLVGYGSMVPLCEKAADALADEASVEVLDVRTLKPLDEALLASAAKTGRVVLVQEAPRTCGYAAELAAILAEKAILDLRGPVLRVTGYDVPYPYWQIEDMYMPSVERVVDAARRLLAF